MRHCKHYAANIENNKELISEECLNRAGNYQLEEVVDHFWKSGNGRAGTCKHCEKHKRATADNTYDPVLTRDWPRDENGRLLSYWHVLGKDIILKVRDD